MLLSNAKLILADFRIYFLRQTFLRKRYILLSFCWRGKLRFQLMGKSRSLLFFILGHPAGILLAKLWPFSFRLDGFDKLQFLLGSSRTWLEFWTRRLRTWGTCGELLEESPCLLTVAILLSVEYLWELAELTPHSLDMRYVTVLYISLIVLHLLNNMPKGNPILFLIYRW